MTMHMHPHTCNRTTHTCSATQPLAMNVVDTKSRPVAAELSARDHLNADVWELDLVADELARLTQEHLLLTTESLSATPAHLSLLDDTVQQCHAAIDEVAALESRANALLTQASSPQLTQIETQLHPQLKQIVSQITQVSNQQTYYSLVRDVLLAQQSPAEPSIDSCKQLELLLQRAKRVPEELGIQEDEALVHLILHLRDEQQAKLLTTKLERLNEVLTKTASDQLRELLGQVAHISQDKCLAALITPIATRFAYHFLGDRQTNQLARPDWYTGYLRKLALSQAPFLATLHPLIVPAHKWIAALTSLATDKLVTDWPDLTDPKTPNLGLAARTWMVVGGLVEEVEVVMRAAGVGDDDESSEGQGGGWKVPEDLVPGMGELVRGMVEQVLEQDQAAMEWELPEDEWQEEAEDGDEGVGGGPRLTKAAAKWGQYWQLLLDIPPKLAQESATQFVKHVLAQGIDFAIDQLVTLFRRAPASDFPTQLRIACTMHALAHQVQEWSLTLPTDPKLLTPHLTSTLDSTLTSLLDTSAHRLSSTLLLLSFRDAHVPLATALTMHLHIARAHLPRTLYKRWWTKFRAHFDRDCAALMLAGRTPTVPASVLLAGASAAAMLGGIKAVAAAASVSAAPGGMVHPSARAEIQRIVPRILSSTLVQFAPATPAAVAFPRLVQAAHLASLSHAQRRELRAIVDDMMQEVGWASGANSGEWQRRASGWRVEMLGVAEVAAALDGWVGEVDMGDADAEERDEFR
ncbi:hypothetical protein BCR44DRAFT_1434339 [Catenaria anguillulae PL171]|uniref:TIP-1 family-domain-containing protein n=1 Tax=Catenaria anguillulae PL171 TaxID=765915 RepID=A0A1Y2HNE1_9FUNG|nr:hypothetical protein BCR44DRAFT_1434339 [Catenaria anguillulae PL171]